MSDTATGMDPCNAKVVDLAAFRRARAPRRSEDGAKAAPAAVAGAASYHEAAIREEDRTRRT